MLLADPDFFAENAVLAGGSMALMPTRIVLLLFE
jgi:hypothetical protein